MRMKRATAPGARAVAAEIEASVGQRLLRVARQLDERAIAEVNRQAGRSLLRPALTRVFPHIDFAGVRITDLAQRLGVTKQAASQLVAELQADGAVELVRDPDDGRARRVRWSAKGLQALRHGLGVLAGIERQLEARVGRARMAALAAALVAVEEALGDG
jgi:DNA-binding MarR family transcriptional regulator